MRTGRSAGVEGVSGERLAVVCRRRVCSTGAGAIHVRSRGGAGGGRGLSSRGGRRVQRGTMAIGIGRARGGGFLCFDLGPLAFHCPVPCSSGRGREELDETRASRASHGEKGRWLAVPTCSNHHLWGRRCWATPCMGVDGSESRWAAAEWWVEWGWDGGRRANLRAHEGGHATKRPSSADREGRARARGRRCAAPPGLERGRARGWAAEKIEQSAGRRVRQARVWFRETAGVWGGCSEAGRGREAGNWK